MMIMSRTLVPLKRLPVTATRFSSSSSALPSVKVFLNDETEQGMHKVSTSGNQDLFKQINKFASERKWDSINNAPKLFLFSKDRAEVYKIYHQMVSPNANIFGRSPYGMYTKAVWRLFLLFGGTWAAYSVYEMVVPEEYRMHYKYQEKHH